MNVVMFGGLDASLTELSQTWLWNGVGWKRIHPAHSPTPRDSIEMAFDPINRQVVLFGGQGATGCLRDTWTWDGKDWTRRHPPHAPPRACSYGIAFDPITSDVLLLTPDSPDTWLWNGSDWKRVRPSSPPLAVDVVGPTVGTPDGATLFGGADCSDYCDTFFRNTWTWDGTTWTKRLLSVRPKARYSAGIAFDRSTGDTVMFGGYGYDGSYRDTWIWDGSGWTPVHPATSPPRRRGTRMAFDPVLGQVLLFGGEGEGGTFIGDTWTWDGTTWIKH